MINRLTISSPVWGNWTHNSYSLNSHINFHITKDSEHQRQKHKIQKVTLLPYMKQYSSYIRN